MKSFYTEWNLNSEGFFLKFTDSESRRLKEQNRLGTDVVLAVNDDYSLFFIDFLKFKVFLSLILREETNNKPESLFLHIK